jgi:hypothetical protein
MIDDCYQLLIAETQKKINNWIVQRSFQTLGSINHKVLQMRGEREEESSECDRDFH